MEINVKHSKEFVQGWVAFINRKPRSENPYEKGTRQAQEWENGWVAHYGEDRMRRK